MRKKVLAAICCLSLACVTLFGCGGKSDDGNKSGGDTSAATKESTEGGSSSSGDVKIALITMDSIDQYWLSLRDGAVAEAEAKGVTLDFNSPNTKDDAQQIEAINNAVANGYDAIMVAANGPDSVSGAIKDAIAAGIKVVYVDSPANVEAEATFSTDNKAAGKTAGETMISALKEKGITSGDIGIVNVNTATQSCVDREAGFRSAFEGTEFNLLETQYCEGDAAKAQEIAQNYITQGVVAAFGCNEGSTTGVGNAIKASGNDKLVGVGFDTSDSIKSLITDGYLYATMSQNPGEMGRLGVDACLDAINGTSHNGEVVDTGVSVLVKDLVQ
ncbi:MAG: substrate-binding domain-containing protein [Coprococcus sp.]